MRGDVQRLYAWCRWCDDGVDTAESPEAAGALLDRVAADLQRIGVGQPPHTRENAWLGDVAARHGLNLAAATALLQGMRTDLAPASGWSEPDLLRYSFRVAGSVGVLMCPVLGMADPRFLPHAASLGIGMQLTNIARDVGEDWGRGRCYLPVEWTGGLRPGGGPPDADAVRRGVRQALDVADSYYVAGELGVGALPRSSRLAVRSAARVYRAIGSRIRRRGFRVLARRTAVPLPEKLWRVAGAALPAGRAAVVASGDPPIQRALASARYSLLEHGVQL